MKNIRFFSENFHFLVVKFSIYLNRQVFVMPFPLCCLSVVFYLNLYTISKIVAGDIR